jgi:hypothetical protein
LEEWVSTDLGGTLLTGPPLYARATAVPQYDFGTGDLSLDITFSCVAGQGGPLLSKWNGVVGWKLSILSDGKIEFRFNALSYVSEQSVDDNLWHVLRVSVSRQSQYAFICLDGLLIGTLPILGEAGVNNLSDLLLGWDGERYHTGGISEARLSNRVRSTTSYPIDSRQFTDDQYTVALFHWNEGGGSVTYDASTTRNDLYLSGGNLYTFIEGPYEVCPITVVREQVWRAIDTYPNMIRFCNARNVKKYRYREGDEMPTLLTEQNSPALTVIPSTMPDIKPDTNRFHAVKIPLQVEGWLYHKEISDIEYFWWITLKSLYYAYDRGTTAGRFNYIKLSDMFSRGPSFQVQLLTDRANRNATLFSNFKDILMFEVRENLLG